MSSSRALCCLPSMKKQKYDFNKTMIRFGFCDIQNNQGLGMGYQPQPSTLADNPYLDLDYSGYHKKPHPIIVYNCFRVNSSTLNRVSTVAFTVSVL